MESEMVRITIKSHIELTCSNPIESIQKKISTIRVYELNTLDMLFFITQIYLLVFYNKKLLK